MKIYTDIDLSPNIAKYLPLVDEKLLFYKQYGLKHPSALYNSSIGKIEGALKDFLEIYKTYYTLDIEKIDKDNTYLLLKNYRDLLYFFREYFDDCLHIIKSFIEPPQNEKKDRNQYGWLDKNAQNIVSDFFNNVSEYKTYIDNTVNELKHNNGSLCSVIFYNSQNNSDNCLGYFVANVVNDSFDAVEKIHPKMGKSHTAFSYRRDLMYNLFNIYNISEEMMKLVSDKIGINLQSLNANAIKAPDIKKQIFIDLMEMPAYHFPDEYMKLMPIVSLRDDGKMKLEYPSTVTIKKNRLDKIIATHSGDGHTRAFCIPYM